MDLEEIEANYQRAIEKADENFLANLREGKSRKEAEQLYKKELAQARENYARELANFLKKTSFYQPKNNKTKGKEEKVKPLRVVPANLELSATERFKYKYELFKFRTRIKLKNFARSITPAWAVYYRIKLRLSIARAVKITKFILSEIARKIQTLLTRVAKFIKS
ncbi:hypothetical protein D6817_03630, partial [Candidatus Pacearchaeota archaeon]